MSHYLLVLVLLVAMAVPATAGHALQQHWVKRGDILTVFLVDHTKGRFPVTQAIHRWNRSPVLHIVKRNECPPNRGCISVYLKGMRQLGVTTLYQDRDRHLVGVRVDLTANRPLSGNQRLSLACHELGHAVGLGHRSGGETCMVNGRRFPLYPDAHDYDDLERQYMHRH